MPQNKEKLHLFRDYRKLASIVEDGATFCAFDTETTGLHSEQDFLMEIGAVKFNKNGIISTFDELIKPPVPISSFITSITHITDKMVENCPTVVKILPDFLRFSDSCILLAHNAPFDLGFINMALERITLPTLKNLTIDTLPLSRWAYPKLGKYNLQFLAKQFDISVRSAHRADDDARVCMELFNKCLNDTMSLQKLEKPKITQDMLNLF